VAVTAGVSIASPLLNAGGVDGTVTLSSALRYDAAARVLRAFTAEELSFGSKVYEIGDITVRADGIKFALKWPASPFLPWSRALSAVSFARGAWHSRPPCGARGPARRRSRGSRPPAFERRAGAAWRR